MLPLLGIPQTLRKSLQSYRSVFCRTARFTHVSRYLTGLLLSPNKTLQSIYHQWAFPAGEPVVKRRSMHASVFESSGWSCESLMHQHRQIVSPLHRGNGRIETFHEFAKQIVGFEPAQLRKEEVDIPLL